jgi:hypothetical protein
LASSLFSISRTATTSQHQHDQRLHQFGWLKRDYAKVNPALTATAHKAHKLNHDKQNKQQQV